MKPVYIHYGDTNYCKNKFIKPSNLNTTKPRGGLWGSRMTDRQIGYYDYADYCHDNDITIDNSKWFMFTVKENANIIEIKTIDDLRKLPEIGNRTSKLEYDDYSFYQIDFEKCLKEGIDGIELIGEPDNFNNLLHDWGCNSLLVLNQNIISAVMTKKDLVKYERNKK